MEINPSLDDISNLPGVILEDILQRLPIRDSVRTSILSRQWKDKWTTIPYIIFDENSFRRGGKKILTDKFIGIVDQVLKKHRGEIHKFTLGFILESILSR